MATRVTRPTAPAMPAELVAIIREGDRTMNALDRILRSTTVEDVWSHFANGEQQVNFIARNLDALSAWEASPAGQEYGRQVREYNAQAAAWNAQLAADRQRQINDRETAKVRQARCPHCFTVKKTADAACVNC